MDYKIKGETLTEIADAIREKTGSTGSIKPEEMAEKVSDVYDAGKSFGTLETVTGNPVRLDYIHPVQHEISVQLTSDTITDFSGITVTQYGKNLVPYPFAETTLTREGITYTDNGDGSITLNGTAINKSYFILRRNCNYGETMMAHTNMNGTNGEFTVSAQLYYGGSADRTLYISINTGTTFANETIYPQVEYGTASTVYEPYIAPTEHVANADGVVEGIKSMAPTTTLMAEGATITAEYYVADDYHYHRFWDAYQDYGRRYKYQNAFGGIYWNDETLKQMKYRRPWYRYGLAAYMMFAKSEIVDLTKVFDNDFVLFLSGAQNTFFSCANLERVGKMLLKDYTAGTFNECAKLSIIDELTVDTSSGTSVFANVPSLTYVKFAGEDCTGLPIDLSSAKNSTTITIPEDVYDNNGNLVYSEGQEVTEEGLLYYPTINTLIKTLKPGAGKTLNLGTNKAKLTEEDIITITQTKGWTLV